MRVRIVTKKSYYDVLPDELSYAEKFFIDKIEKREFQKFLKEQNFDDNVCANLYQAVTGRVVGLTTRAFLFKATINPALWFYNFDKDISKIKMEEIGKDWFLKRTYADRSLMTVATSILEPLSKLYGFMPWLSKQIALPVNVLRNIVNKTVDKKSVNNKKIYRANPSESVIKALMQWIPPEWWFIYVDEASDELIKRATIVKDNFQKNSECYITREHD